MKWKKTADKNGVYLTYSCETGRLGLLHKINGKWVAKTPNGIFEINAPSGIDYFCRIVTPKNEKA